MPPFFLHANFSAYDENTKVVALARVGWDDQKVEEFIEPIQRFFEFILYGLKKSLYEFNKFNEPYYDFLTHTEIFCTNIFLILAFLDRLLYTERTEY